MKKHAIIIRSIKKKDLEDIALCIRNGGIVVFPTETVYGLGANVFDSRAIEKIFRAKGRPSDNPLIVHVYNLAQLELVAKDVPEVAIKLFKKFSPGPLTIVLPKKDTVPSIVTAGLPTIAVRIPSHPVARAILKEVKLPIAAPSANISGRPSPTTFEMAKREMENRVDFIIDGGDCKFGLESTVVQIKESEVIILRPGAITKEMLQSVLLHPHYIVKQFDEVKVSKPLSPGQKHAHYKPFAEVYIVDKIDIEKIKKLFGNKKIGILTIDSRSLVPENVILKSFKNLSDYAKNLYRAFVEMDSSGVEVILVQSVPEKGIGRAIMNRLLKAAENKYLNDVQENIPLYILKQ